MAHRELNLRERRKLVRLVGLRKAVIKQMKEGWSPEQIAGRLQFVGQTMNGLTMLIPTIAVAKGRC